MFKKRHLLILLLATVLIYCGVVYWSIQDYEEWEKANLERIPPNIYPPEIGYQAAFNPYIYSGCGMLMIVLGVIIGLVWPIILFMKKKTKLRIAALTTVIIAGAAFPLALVAYQELYVTPLLLSRPEALRPLVDPEPFLSTVYWDLTKLIWISLGSFWLAVAAIRVLKPRLYSDQ